MSAAPKSILTQDGIEVLASGEPGVFQYIPRVQPEASPSGDPTLMLLKHPNGGILQMGARLDAGEPALEKIRKTLSAREETPSPFRLEQAPINVRSARLLLILPSGTQELQKAQPSAMMPSTALFRVSLNPEQTKLVEEALNGKQGRLTVVYDMELAARATARVRIEGDATGAKETLSPDAAEEDALGWIEQSLRGGKLRLTKETSGERLDGLVQEALTAAKTKAAKMILGFQSPAITRGMQREDTVESEVSLEEPRTIALSRDSDVANWFGGGKRPNLTAVSTGPPPAGGNEIKVRLGFDPKDLPLAFLEIKGTGAQPGVLRGPGWAPVRVNSSGTLSVTVHYASSAPVFFTQVPASGAERALTLEEVGIAQIVFDASTRKEAGAKKLTGTVKYMRAGAELENWPVRFQYGDWREEWFVVTGATALNGSLEYEWQETGPDGSVQTGGPSTTDRTTIQIK